MKHNNKNNILTDRQKAVLETVKMRLTEKESLDYLKDCGFEISDTTLYREKSKLENMKLKRLYQIAKYGFEEQHLERIDQLEMIQRLMWQDYFACKSPYQRVIILEKIANIQPYLSSYYEVTKEVMKESNYMKKYNIPEFETRSNDDGNVVIEGY
jgi:hypothetical protein